MMFLFSSKFEKKDCVFSCHEVNVENDSESTVFWNIQITVVCTVIN
jgi:hypothetical protein